MNRFSNAMKFHFRIKEETVSKVVEGHLSLSGCFFGRFRVRVRGSHLELRREMRTSFEMSERKVLSKYYPPDFDPSKLVRNNGAKKGPKQQTVCLMAPFTMRCNTCGEYIYRRKKFNARKENPQENYLSTKLFRFRIRCTRCRAEITFKTDPKNKDYTG